MFDKDHDWFLLSVHTNKLTLSGNLSFLPQSLSLKSILQVKKVFLFSIVIMSVMYEKLDNIWYIVNGMHA